jgi:hypothetical protein
LGKKTNSLTFFYGKKKRKKKGIYRHDPTKNTRIDEKYL